MAGLAQAANPGSLQAAGNVIGKITDGTGSTVSRAEISLHNAQQVLITSASSGESGDFRFEGVPVGTYAVTVSTTDFAPRRVAVEVRDGQTVEVAVILELRPLASEVTVTADVGQVQEITQVAQPVNVVAEDEIEQRTNTVLAEAVKEEAGLSVQRTSSTIGAVVVRGLTEVTVFVDGVRVTNSAQRGGINTFFNLTDPGSITGVEVLRGTNSAQYGSDSLGGTVQLISRPPEFGRTDRPLRGQWTSLFASSSATFAGSGVVNYGGESSGLLVNLNARRVNTVRSAKGLDGHAAVTRFLGIPSNVLGNRLTDTGFTQYGGNVRYQYAGPDGQNFIFHYQRSQQDGGKRYDQLLGGDGNLIADLRNLMGDFGYARYLKTRASVVDNASATFSFNSQREERVNQGGQGDPLAAITSERERTTSYGISFFLDKHLAAGHTFLFGGDLYHDKVTAPAHSFEPATRVVTASRPRVPNGSRYILSGLYVQDVMDLLPGRFRANGALRYNVASYRSRSVNSPLVGGQPLFPDDGLRVDDFSGRVGVVGTPVEAVSLSFSYSHGFRAPNITALGSVGLVGVGFQVAAVDIAGLNGAIGTTADDTAVSTNRAVTPLQSEISNNVDLGIRFTTDRVRTSLTGFQIDINDVIVRQTLILPAGAVGIALGSQRIERQLSTGAVFVSLSPSPVLVQANFGGSRLRGVEYELDIRLPSSLHFGGRFSAVRAEDREAGSAPNLGGAGIPPASGFLSLRYSPRRSYWIEAYSTLAARQSRLSSLDLADRRTGATRSRANIANFFNRGARVRGLIGNGADGTANTADDVLMATGETLAQVQNRVLGSAESAPLFSAIPGYGLFGVRGNFRLTERSDLGFDIENIADKAHRAPGWGIDGAGRGLTLRYRHEF